MQIDLVIMQLHLEISQQLESLSSFIHSFIHWKQSKISSKSYKEKMKLMVCLPLFATS